MAVSEWVDSFLRWIGARPKHWYQDLSIAVSMTPFGIEFVSLAYLHYHRSKSSVPTLHRSSMQNAWFALDFDFAGILRYHGGHLLEAFYHGEREPGGQIWVWDCGCVTFSTVRYTKTHKIASIRIDLSDKTLRDDILSCYKSHELTACPSGVIKAIVQSDSGLTIRTIGEFSDPLVRSNYSHEVTRGYDTLLDEVQNPSPAGRLTVLSGPPGTGKSHLLRSLAFEGKVPLIIVPTALLGSLSSPQMIDVILSARQSKKQPTVLVLEDADRALVKRDAGSSDISELLNLTDGLLGEIGDLRIIATTNAKVIEMDHAFTRAGRLSQVVLFDYLSPEQANLRYKEIAGDESDAPFSEPTALADIYSSAKKRQRSKHTGSLMLSNDRRPQSGQYL